MVVALFTWNASFFHLPGQGFTYLIQFGEKLHRIYLPEVKASSHYEMPNSVGYDSQYYAQIAMHPRLSDPVLFHAVDGLPYRARRILFPIVAWVLAGGDPVRAMHLFAVENLVCWYLLALLLLRWFPPVSWGNVLRWTAMLFSFGLIFSVARALLDGPSLVLTVLGMTFLELRRPWIGAALLGLSGLGKDTNVLAGSALELPRRGEPDAWRAWLLQGALVVGPLAAWMVCLRLWLGNYQETGDARNFAPPFVALADKLLQSVSQLVAEGGASVAKFDLLVMAGILTQFLFFVLRPRWREPWWRLGASYCVLMAFLGGAVWENYPSASARVLLPMTLAFNILVPRGRWWPMVLLVGNLGVFGSADIFKPPGRESFVVEGPTSLRVNPRDGSVVEALYGPRNWWRPERSRWEFWRWSQGDATVSLRNPQPFTVVARLRLRLRSADARGALIRQGSRVLWQGMLAPRESLDVVLPDIDLPPGDTVLDFTSDRPAAFPGGNDPRRLSFSLRNLEIDLVGRREETPGR